MTDQGQDLADALSDLTKRLSETDRKMARVEGVTDTLSQAYVPRQEVLGLQHETRAHTERAIMGVRWMVFFNAAMLVIIFLMLCFRFNASAPVTLVPDHQEIPASPVAPAETK